MAHGNAARRALRRRRLNGKGNGSGGTNRWAQLLIACTGVGVVLMAGAGVTGYGVYQSYANDLRPPDEVINSQPSGGAQIFDRNGKLLYEYVDDKSGLRSPVKLEDISPWIIAATISTEDLSYWDNPGVNYRGLARAGLEYVGVRDAQSAETTGGSSITQQLVKNIYIDPEERYERSVKRKLKETVYAIELTNRYSKDQILEWYLNQISYGGLYNGVEAAAMGYFGKHAKDLNLAEAAMLAGIPASPSKYDPVNNPEAATERRNQVLRLMADRDRTKAEIDGKQESVVRLQVNDDGATVDITDTMFYLSTVLPMTIVPERFPVEAPHWVFDYIQPQVEKLYGVEALYRGGLSITTTLDLDMQAKAQTALERWIAEFEESSDAHNGAVVAIDPRTSEVLVMIGSRDYFRDDIEGRNNNATSFNSPGSTLKPFAYAAAFEHLGWGPETEILDTEVSFPDIEGRTFTPRNPSGNFQGPVTVRTALGNSLNIPAVKTAAYVGVPNVVAEYKKFGITGLDGGGYGPAIVVGGVDIKLVDVAYAYTVFANNGIMRGVPTALTLGPGNRELDPVSILEIRRQDGTILFPETEDHRVKVQERKVLDPQYSYMITSILSDPNAHCITYGCGALSIGRPWGVKTGTSEPFENSRAIGETWTYGYTPDLVAGVWAGNSDNSPVHNITSTSISYRTLRDFMQEALADVPASSFIRPPGLEEVETCTPSFMKADEECGRKVKNLLPSSLKLEDDSWWQRAKIDIRTGLLADELTPPQFVEERYGLVLPEGLGEFEKKQAEEWARTLHAIAAPEDSSGAPLPVRIDSPDPNEKLKGVVTITGKAESDHFIAYRLEFAPDGDPSNRTLLIRSTDPQPGGGLGLWNTDDVEDGLYVLWLTVEDEARGDLQYYVPVIVGTSIRRSPGARPSPTPEADDGG